MVDQDGKAEKIQSSYNSVLLTLLGTIQGLALTTLADRLPAGNTIEFEPETLYKLSHFCACFMIVARVTQTYISAALTYVRSRFSVIELFSMLIVGLLEYWILKILASKGISGGDLHIRIALLSFMALLSHCITARQELKGGEQQYKINMQLVNLLFSFLIGVFCFGAFFDGSPLVRAVISACVTIMLLVNIIISVRNTAPAGLPAEVLTK